jgi:hypothetical protein
VNFSNEGLSLWYGTPDAPAPGDTGIVPRRGASLMVGVHPAHPANTLKVRFRVDGGRERFAVGRSVRTDFDKQDQYFVVTFPEFFGGKMVEYQPVLSCSGRQVPAPYQRRGYSSKFALASATERRVSEPTPNKGLVAQSASEYRYTAGLAFVANVAVNFASPSYVGDTPAGMRVDFLVRDGVVEGDGFKASVVEGSADRLLVRPDGMGVANIRAVFATTDGARLDVESGGYVDFGPDGYRKALAHALPDRAAIVLTPLITTRHPRYRWLTRVQCVGVGYTNLAENKGNYSVYASSSRALP